MAVIAKGNGLEGPADLDEILDRVRYETSKQSIQFSIRALIAKGLIYKKGVAKRRGRQRVVIAATDVGKAIAGVRDAPANQSYLEDELDTVIEGFDPE